MKTIRNLFTITALLIFVSVSFAQDNNQQLADLERAIQEMEERIKEADSENAKQTEDKKESSKESSETKDSGESQKSEKVESKETTTEKKEAVEKKADEKLESKNKIEEKVEEIEKVTEPEIEEPKAKEGLTVEKPQSVLEEKVDELKEEQTSKPKEIEEPKIDTPTISKEVVEEKEDIVVEEEKPEELEEVAPTEDTEASESLGFAGSAKDIVSSWLDKVDLDGIAKSIEGTMEPISKQVGSVVFSGVVPENTKGEPLITNKEGKAETIPFVLVWLALASIILTFVFWFLNLRGLPLAISTIFGKYSSKDDPGEISHFQALSSAVSGTVGLGNIAGVAVGISYGGPGVAFWMVVMGLFGMTTKFAECTLGVKYRQISPKGKVFGGPMYYLRHGLAERDMKGLGWFLATCFAVCCSIAALGGGNMFQVNQSLEQLINVTGGEESFFADREGKMIFGIGLLIVAGSVIMFGIKGIGKVTSILVPLMCVAYIIGSIVVLVSHSDKVMGALQTIWDSAFNFKAMGTGGAVMAILWGIRRAAFSNEAGFGSAPIAHSAVRTKYPASEGLVALLEPFIDTVLVCSMTALVIVTTGAYEMEGLTGNGIAMTSAAFETVHEDFRIFLAVAAIIFALSTLISWSYYGQQAWAALFGRNGFSILIFKLIFLFFILVGSVLSLSSVIDFSDGFLFLMSIFNLIGVYMLIPDVKRELKRYREHVRAVKKGLPSPHETSS